MKSYPLVPPDILSAGHGDRPTENSSKHSFQCRSRRARLWQQAFLAEYKHYEADHDHDRYGDNKCDGGPSCFSFNGTLSSVGVTPQEYLTKTTSLIADQRAGA